MKKTALALTLAGLLGIASVSHAQGNRDYIKNYVNKNSPVVQKAQPQKKGFLKNLEFEIGAVAEQYSKNPIADYYNKVNQDFKDGKYTSTTPISQWKDVQAPSFNTIGGEAAIKYKLNNKTRVGVTFGANSGKSTSNYNEDYDIYDSVSNKTAPTHFERTETANISNQSVGVKLERDLSKKFSVSLAGKSGSCKIDGNMDYTFNTNADTFVRGSPWPYAEFRNSTYSGTGNVNSAELGIDANITKNISIGISAGAKTGKVKVTGSGQTKYLSGYSCPLDKTLDPDYPEFDYDLNNNYANFKVSVKF
jgi:hypothetical protein